MILPWWQLDILHSPSLSQFSCYFDWNSFKHLIFFHYCLWPAIHTSKRQVLTFFLTRFEWLMPPLNSCFCIALSMGRLIMNYRMLYAFLREWAVLDMTLIRSGTRFKTNKAYFTNRNLEMRMGCSGLLYGMWATSPKCVQMRSSQKVSICFRSFRYYLPTPYCSNYRERWDLLLNVYGYSDHTHLMSAYGIFPLALLTKNYYFLDSLRSRSTSAASSNLHSFDDFLPSAAITSTSSSLPEQGGLSSPNLRITGVVDKVKSVKSAVSRMQTSKSEGGRHRHSKSSSLIPSFRKSQFSSLPSNRGRAYSEIRDQIRTDDGDETMRELYQSNLSSGGLESSPPPRSSFRPTSSHQSGPASESVRILSAKTWRRLSSAPIMSAVTPSRPTWI